MPLVGRLLQRVSRLIAAVAICCCASSARAQLRIVDYNIAQNYDIAGDPGGLDVIFAAIGAEVRNGFSRPIDVLAVQEANNDGSDAAALAAILNGVYGVTTYAAAPVPANGVSGGNGLPGLVYNSASVSLLGTLAFGDVGTGSTQQPRSSLRYQLRPTGYDAAADFYFYNNHYKADEGSANQARRHVEAQGIRSDADGLGEGTHAIYAGDFNVYRDTEAMYQTLLAAGPGQAFDPIDMPGSWSAPSQAETFKSIHTQSPATVAAFSGQSVGGMNDRFDFQLVTGEFLDGEGLSYIGGSYRTFGNNGTHTVNEAITTGTGAVPSVLTALAQASDHMPVVVDYQLPAKLGVAVASAPTSVQAGAAVSIDVFIENLASALTTLGADELDYTLSVSGDLIAGATGTIAALAAGATHQITLNTATPGLKNGLITVSTSSQGAANALFTLPISFIVGGGGPPVRTTIARDDFDDPINLLSFTQSPAPGAFADSQDGFERYQVGVSAAIPNDLMDDSTASFPTDSIGVIDRSTKTDGWFGVADTENAQNLSGEVTASWAFNVSEASALEISIDMGAMGNFEAADVFDWSFALDDAPFAPLFTSNVLEGSSANYTLADGDVFNLIDPLAMSIAGGSLVQLSNVLQTLTASIAGTGDVLTLRFDGNTNGDDEAYVFDNIVVTGLLPSFAEADFNEDGFVDGDDLATWKTNFGASVATREEGDANLDGVVDGSDFLVWQRQFNGGGEIVLTSAAVPEPASILLALAATLCWRRFARESQGRVKE